ncbi:SUN domain-containing protein 1-like [Chaetodon trifascialis]|uniref:SUN domain-containing protein 1-like n=1 Tax=Chaetodon trifascialis TaxID=109706 RepID=UPI0039917BE5
MSYDEDVDLQSWGWTDVSGYSSAASDSEKEQRVVLFLHTGTMSRCSLRLDDGLPHSSASFSVGGSSWRGHRSLKSRRSQQLSVSCSDSVLLSTPRKNTSQSLLNSSLHSVASDASLLSSLLDHSAAQETTLVDTFWGLDPDVDPKESTIIAEQSTVLADRTLIGSDGLCPKHLVQTLSRVHCNDCEPHADRKESTHCLSSKYTSSSSSSSSLTGPSEPRDTETSTVYCRDRNRKTRTDVLQLWLNSCLLRVRRAAAGCVTLTWQVCRGLTHTDDRRAGADCKSVFCGVMNLKESTTNQKELHPNGSLCQAAGDVYRWLHRRWHHVTSSFLLTRLPLRLLLVLLPLLLLFTLSITGWRTPVSDAPVLMSPQRQSAEGATEESKEEPLYGPPPPAEAPTGEEEASAAAEESARLVRLEQSLTALWERVEAGGRQAEQRHGQVLQLYTDLQQQVVSAQSGLLDRQLDRLRTGLDVERQQREQSRQQQQRQASRLDQLELQLQTLAAQTEVRHVGRETTVSGPPQAALSETLCVGVDRQSHDALLAEVARLEAALEDVKRDVEGLSGCRDSCRRLDRIQQTMSEQVSAQVREEVRTLVYGNQLTVRGGARDGTAGLPESLLQWLSQWYVSGADLQASLASLELSILQNISLQLEQRRAEETAGEADPGATGAAVTAVTQEDVHVIVKNALRLFAQDRTGLPDFALESGGGSILSTRCSETYETKAALLSLFGLPLWYFSQSPRVVIQPDVHPGNCWAFRGSAGFLVIRLSMTILPTAFSLEHVPRALAPSGTLRSAPRDFSVYGLDDEGQDGGTLLGTYTYDEDGEALQTYAVTEDSDRAFQIIEVQVLSNWGHPDYTCMYRFRVHGRPRDA